MQVNKLRRGDYVPNGLGGFQCSQGDEALLEEALFRLSCRRGALPFLPELGSRLHLLFREKPASRAMVARQYVAQALEDLPLQVQQVEIITLADDRAQVRVTLLAGGSTTQLEVTV